MKRLISLILVAAALVGGASPASAAQSTSGYGAQAVCRYNKVEGGKFGWTVAQFKRIVVKPPTLFANRNGNQQVGWRFVVTRSLDRQHGPWKVTYRSPIQKAVATLTKAAVFSTKDVNVAIPNVEEPDDIWYHIELKLFWYGPNGRADSTSSYLFTQYRMFVNKHDEGVWALDDNCPAIAKQWFDGPF